MVGVVMGSMFLGEVGVTNVQIIWVFFPGYGRKLSCCMAVNTLQQQQQHGTHITM